MTENNVESHCNFHQISLKEKRNFLEWGNTETNLLGGLSLSKICVSSAQKPNKLGDHVITSDWLMLISVGSGAIIQFNAAGENQNVGWIYGVYERWTIIGL